MISSYLFEDFMLVFNSKQFLFAVVFSDFDEFDGINILGLFPSCHIDLTKSSLTQKL
jgi:hypothetical protein